MEKSNMDHTETLQESTPNVDLLRSIVGDMQAQGLEVPEEVLSKLRTATMLGDDDMALKAGELIAVVSVEREMWTLVRNHEIPTELRDNIRQLNARHGNGNHKVWGMKRLALILPVIAALRQKDSEWQKNRDLRLAELASHFGATATSDRKVDSLGAHQPTAMPRKPRKHKAGVRPHRGQYGRQRQTPTETAEAKESTSTNKR